MTEHIVRVRTGQAPAHLTREAFGARFRERFVDPAFDGERDAIARLDRVIGYREPYATSHDALDADTALHREVRNAAGALANAIVELRAGRLSKPDAGLRQPRAK